MRLKAGRLEQQAALGCCKVVGWGLLGEIGEEGIARIGVLLNDAD